MEGREDSGLERKKIVKKILWGGGRVGTFVCSFYIILGNGY